MKFSVIIPCYNESKNIDNLLSEIIPLQKEYDLEYILVENGSVDDSKEVFKNKIENKYKNIKVVYIDKNQGYGYGIQEGLKVSEGEYAGWIHADLQTSPFCLKNYFDYINNMPVLKKIFIKAKRKNRSFSENFFTLSQALFDSFLFHCFLYDVNSTPVLFEKSLLDKFDINSMPNEFSIDLYIYLMAKKYKYEEKRIDVVIQKRKNGISSWNNNFLSRIKFSLTLIMHHLRIKLNKKVY